MNDPPSLKTPEIVELGILELVEVSKENLFLYIIYNIYFIKENFMTNQILTILFALLTIVVTIYSYYLSVRKKIEESALTAINDAEDLDAEGKEKMRVAVDTVYSLVPSVIKPFLNKQLVEVIIQSIFDKVEAYAKKQMK